MFVKYEMTFDTSSDKKKNCPNKCLV